MDITFSLYHIVPGKWCCQLHYVVTRWHSSCNYLNATYLVTLCSAFCQSGAFQCSNGQGISVSSSGRCDGRRDCTDGSDETGCANHSLTRGDCCWQIVCVIGNLVSSPPPQLLSLAVWVAQRRLGENYHVMYVCHWRVVLSTLLVPASDNGCGGGLGMRPL